MALFNKITFTILDNLREDEIDNIEYNGLITIFNRDSGSYEVYSQSQSEESDPDPIYQTTSITEIYNYLIS